MELEPHVKRVNVLARISYWSLLLWLPMLLAAGMATGDPRRGAFAWILVGIVAIAPLFVILAPRIARRAVSEGKLKLAYAVVIVPQALFWMPLVLVLVMTLVSYIRYAF